MTIDTNGIWEEFKDRLKKYVFCHVRNEDDAKDILQEVFCKIHKNISTLNDANKLGRWIYRITRNTIIDYYRLQKSKAIYEEVPKFRLNVPVLKIDIPKEVASLCVKPMIDSLPEKYRQAILLTEYEGLTQKEMAEKLGLSISGAKSRVQRARKKLKEMLHACCKFELDRYHCVIDYQYRSDSTKYRKLEKVADFGHVF